MFCSDSFSARGHASERLGDLDHPLGLPVLLVPQHRPGNHGDLASQRDTGFLLASLLFATDPFVDALGPRVVPQRGPSTFNKDRSRQRIASLGDAAVAIGFAGLILPRHQTEVRRDLASILKAMRIVDAGDEDLSGARSDAGDRRSVATMRASFLPIASSFLTTTSICSESESRMVSSMSSSPFQSSFGAAVVEWLAKRVDAFAPGVPRFVTGVDRDAVIDEPSADGVFGLVDASVERLAILDQRAELAMLLRRHVDWLEFPHGGHAG